MGFLESLGLMQRMKKGWHVVSVFINESRDWRNWPIRVGTRFFASTCCCQTHRKCKYCESERAVSFIQRFSCVREATDPNAGSFGDDPGVDNSLGGKRGQSVVKCLFEEFTGRFMHQLNQI